jgi:hypothetical protein
LAFCVVYNGKGIDYLMKVRRREEQNKTKKKKGKRTKG